MDERTSVDEPKPDLTSGCAATTTGAAVRTADPRRGLRLLLLLLALGCAPIRTLADPLNVSASAPTLDLPAPYILETDPNHDTLRVTIQTTVSRNQFCPSGNLLLPCPPESVPFRFTLTLLEGLTAVATVERVVNYNLAGNTILPVAELFELDPNVVLNEGVAHSIRYRIQHVEDPVVGTYVTDHTVTTALAPIAHFTGPMHFGTVEATLQLLTSNPVHLGGTNWFIAVGQGVTAGGIPFSHTATTPPPLTVGRDTSGELSVAAGSVEVTAPGDFNWMGWTGKRGVTTLSASGFQTDKLILDLPPGIGWRPAGQIRLRARFELPLSPVKLGADLNPSVDAQGTAPATLQFFSETYPVQFASATWSWSRGVLALVNPVAGFVRSNYYQQWETDVGDIPDSNDGFWSLVKPTTDGGLEIRPGLAGGISVGLAFQAGAFFPHFPHAGFSTDSGAVMRIENNRVVPADSTFDATRIQILYGKGCRDPITPNASPLPQQPVELGAVTASFTPQAGLWVEGTLTTPQQDPAVERHLEIGLGEAGPTHRTDPFVTTRIYVPGTWVPHADAFDSPDDSNALVDEPGEDPLEFNPARYLLSGLRPDLDYALEHPATAAYAAGAGDYAGANLRHFAGLRAESHIGGGSTGFYPLTDRAKFYIRRSGVSGILESADGPDQLFAYGYDVTLTNYGLNFLSNEPQESRINGTIALPYPSAFTQDFTELMLTCCGNLTEGRIAPGDEDKQLAYWHSAEFRSETLRFTHDPNDPCDTGNALLELGITATIGNLEGRHGGFLYPRPDGVLVALDTLGRESHLALPAQASFAGGYVIVPVRHAYYNDSEAFPAAGNPVPGPGWINVAGMVGVPFFRDLAVHAQIEGSGGAFDPPLFVLGGWKDNLGHTFFNHSGYDSAQRGYPPAVPLQDYRTGTNHLAHAEQVWFGLVPFDYPVAFNNVTKTFHSPAPKGLDLVVADVQSQVERLNHELASLQFKSEFDIEALVNPVNLLEQAVEGVVTGFLDELGDAAGPIRDGLDALSDMLDTQSRRLVDDVILPALDTAVITPLADSLTPGLSNLQIDNLLNQHLGAPLADQLDALAQHAANGSAIVQNVNGRLAQVRTALESINNALLTVDRIEDILLSALAQNLVPITNVPPAAIELAKESLLGAGGGDVLPGRLLELKAALEELRGRLNQVIALLEQGEEFAARVEVIFSQAADLAMIGSQASQSLGAWLKNVVYPDVDAYSPEELRERIRTTLRDQILASPIHAAVQTAQRELVYALDAAVRDALATVTQALNDEIMRLLDPLFEQLEEKLSPLKNFGNYLSSAGMSGHAVIRGDRLALLRLDGVARISVQQIPITINSFFEYRELTSDGPAGCVLPAGTRRNEVILGASGAPTSMFGAEHRISLATKFSLNGDPAPLPLGVFGMFERIEGGSAEVETFRIDDLSASLAIGGQGGQEYYLSAYVHSTFSDYQLAGGLFFGTSCTPAPLAFDPKAAEILGGFAPDTFSGVYVFGQGTFPLYDFGCLLRVNIGAEVGAFVGSHSGGRIGGSVSGEAICLVSAKGEADFAYFGSGDTGIYTGGAGLEAKVGLCPLCVQWQKNVSATYQRSTGWDVNF